MSLDVLKKLEGPVVLVGAGKMGGAMLEGWLALGLEPSRVVVLDPNLPAEAAAAFTAKGVQANPAYDAIPPAAVLILAVKPQVAPAVLSSVRGIAGPNTVVVSVMAGRTIGFIQESFPRGIAIVRTIPNTPAAIGQGVTVAVANEAVSADARAAASGLLGAVGIVEWVDDEALIDAATAVSGSGPAYVFLLAEALAKAGAAAGLPADLADRIARGTVSGAGALLAQSGIAPATLRQNVTSPGGTTAAALAVLMDEDEGFGPLLVEAVDAATKRSRELAG
ncbi:pyrroline-5-carboxylate reductase [Azorhizobium oxalatiphilum]|uniref:Pyrroline-5-carboxylate reductase n=1 Tax=Azorhizobium oxalatiphilum TaxID=980631 RepID=A0A917CH63_9HYPH|nr:pyrroline-5-carboxylate reductase [Azorhizobium oxalatiphilum]GGF88367.1 pyrroline-5-carboxylate reductase [Azorhizobium oxalatiphilum]